MYNLQTAVFIWYHIKKKKKVVPVLLLSTGGARINKKMKAPCSSFKIYIAQR